MLFSEGVAIAVDHASSSLQKDLNEEQEDFELSEAS